MADGDVHPRLWEALNFHNSWKEEVRAARDPVPDTLYHYTDVAGLLSILRTNELWATSVAYMNDESELVHSLRMLRQLVDPESYEADAVAATVAEQFMDYGDPYLVCFCTSGDLLSQWRGYGAGGGYALGLNSAGLADLPPERLMLVSVSYDEGTQAVELAELVARWRQVFRDVPPRADDPGTWRMAGLLFAEAFSLVAVRYKKRVFEEEREWRLVYRRLPMLPEEPDDPGELPALRFRHRDQMPLPYVAVKPKEGRGYRSAR